eukprot:TRINITY_DN26523_c0_g1_i1.p1 TRINITY_DN26523_c0_g1~~TRINITY_DN26523_c0_g1_i1.p1  ORF type:complete len:265 (+),score=61.73 TRINITY_DN26523_c0_g1_i1:43-837(+)
MPRQTPKKPEGLVLVPNFISQAEESALVAELLSPQRAWLDKSHLRFANSAQQEFGPVITDAMEVVPAAPRVPTPPATARLAVRVAQEAARLGLDAGAAAGKDGTAFDFCRINHYSVEGGGYMHKHMDSKKCFGPVIACVSLLSDAAMSFYDTRGNSFGMARVYDTAEVPLPRRSLYFLTGAARSQWQHGIRKDQCPQERLSLTFRTVCSDAPRSATGAAPADRRVAAGVRKRPAAAIAEDAPAVAKQRLPAAAVKRRPAAAKSS